MNFFNKLDRAHIKALNKYNNAIQNGAYKEFKTITWDVALGSVRNSMTYWQMENKALMKVISDLKKEITALLNLRNECERYSEIHDYYENEANKLKYKLYYLKGRLNAVVDVYKKTRALDKKLNSLYAKKENEKLKALEEAYNSSKGKHLWKIEIYTDSIHSAKGQEFYIRADSEGKEALGSELGKAYESGWYCPHHNSCFFEKMHEKIRELSRLTDWVECIPQLNPPQGIPVEFDLVGFQAACDFARKIQG